MFTPEGYWSWEELVYASSNWTEQIVARIIIPEICQENQISTSNRVRTAIYNSLVSSGKVETLAEARFAMGVMELWVLANFMDIYEAVLCSPEGRTLRCPPLIKAHGDAFDWWTWPLTRECFSNAEASGYFKAFRAGRFNIGDAQARFVAIDYETGTIQLKANTVGLIKSASYGNWETNDAIMRFINQQIRPILGWSICWNKDVFPKTERDLFVSLGFDRLDWFGTEGDPANNLPPATSGENILRCALAAYPHGKGTATWTDVEVIVGYSRRSIVRALKASGHYETWARTGQTPSR